MGNTTHGSRRQTQETKGGCEVCTNRTESHSQGRKAGDRNLYGILCYWASCKQWSPRTGPSMPTLPSSACHESPKSQNRAHQTWVPVLVSSTLLWEPGDRKMDSCEPSPCPKTENWSEPCFSSWNSQSPWTTHLLAHPISPLHSITIFVSLESPWGLNGFKIPFLNLY